MGKKSTKKMRLERLLSNLGYGGRKEMAMAIKNEWLSIDGEVVKNPAFQVDMDLVARGLVEFDGEVLDQISPFSVMLHKPKGYICSHKDAGDLVYDLMPERWQNRKPSFSSIGRLDKESSGQIIFTDDGDLLHRIIHPKTSAKKHYQVQLRDDLRGNEAELFSSGEFYLDDDDKPLKPAQWNIEGYKSGAMVLSEGRYHQIRRMFRAIGNEVVDLHRLQTGGLSLGDLNSGKWKILDNDDIEKIFSYT